MGEAGREEYKIQSFDAETQQLLKTALKGEHGSPPGWAGAAEGLNPGSGNTQPSSISFLRISFLTQSGRRATFRPLLGG
jgi:hypothetical protein